MSVPLRPLSFVLFTVLAVTAAGQAGSARMSRDDARKIFEAELTKRHVKFARRREPMLYSIKVDGGLGTSDAGRPSARSALLHGPQSTLGTHVWCGIQL